MRHTPPRDRKNCEARPSLTSAADSAIFPQRSVRPISQTGINYGRPQSSKSFGNDQIAGNAVGWPCLQPTTTNKEGDKLVRSSYPRHDNEDRPRDFSVRTFTFNCAAFVTCARRHFNFACCHWLGIRGSRHQHGLPMDHLSQQRRFF